MIYNFRFDRDRRETVLRRLQEQGELCQGWGGGTDPNHHLQKENFRKRTVETYDMENTNVATNLTRMRDFNDGDRLVTPHLPEKGTVSVHEVQGAFPECYTYVDVDDTHLNHRIQIRQSWGLNGTISANHWKLAPWKAKLPWFRLPIIAIEGVGTGFQEIVAALREDPSQKFPESDLSKYLNEMESELMGETQSRLERIAPSGSGISFEEIALHILRTEGYVKKGQHHYDGVGGDVDFVLTRDEVTPFETDETVLFVQVKKHTGKTGVGAVKQVVQMMEKEPDAGGCVITLADRFSDEAQELAERNGIALIDGSTTCRLLMQRLYGPSGTTL
jgi:Holliday junction resolvase-like predicted endonuclease